MKKVKVRLFRYTLGYHPLAPTMCPKNGEIVAAFWPLKKIDPMGVYAEIVNVGRSAHTCIKAGMEPIGKPFDLEYDVPKYSTANQEKALAVGALHTYLSN